MTRVAVIGHIEWVDFVPVQRFPERGDILHAQSVGARAAGGGGVVASVLAELGAEVDFFTALGRDEAGRASLAGLAERNVNVHVAWREAPTRRALTLLEPDGERTIILVLSARDGDELDWARQIAPRSRLFVVTQGAQGGRWCGESQGSWQPAALPGEPRDA
jgi:ribokinase